MALALLTLAYVLSYVDRTIVSLMVGPIRADLGLSDTQFSLLGGLAFALFYSTLGIPFGWWADRGDRGRIVALGIAVWSLMTMVCGFAKSFGVLFAARVGVGIGEAALSPPAYSLLAEKFPAERTGRALAIYSSGVYLGIGISFAAGGALVQSLSGNPPIDLGWMGTLAGWQQVFIIVGAPGLLLAPLALLLLPESRRNGKVLTAPASPPIMPWLRTHKAFLLLHFFGFSMLTLMFNGYLAWEAEFLLREYRMARSDAGLAIGILTLVFGMSGMLAGGMVSDRLKERGDPRGALTAGLGGGIALLPFAAFSPLMPGSALALAMLAPIIFFSAFCFGCAITALQLSTPPTLRARVSALYLLVVNLAGIGLGGTAVAALSDFGLGGDGTRLGEAMAIIGGCAVSVAIPLLLLAKRRMPRSNA